MLFVDAKYANILGSRLRNFKQKNDYLWNYSCPVCGDSSKNKIKARGYIYRKKSDLFVKCHNCGYGTNIGNLIKHVDSNLYNEYVLERYKNGALRYNDHKEVEEVFPQERKLEVLLEDDVLSSLQRLDKLGEDHPAVQYLLKRKIPKEKWKYLYFTPKFKKYTNSIKFHFLKEDDDHPRMIIPFFTNAGKVFAYQARAYGKEEPKYYTIKIDETQEKVYGLDRLDYSKKILIVEGPIDSLFLPNAIAVSGASFDTPTIKSLMTNAVIVMDNEPRSKEITKQLEKYIDVGYSVCMFPETVVEKDINEMILSGKTVDEILHLINTNTVSGVEAKLKFASWRKC